MKTLQNVRNEIIDLAKKLEEAKLLNKSKTASRLQNQINQLRILHLYLETNPREESIIKMRNEVARTLQILESRQKMWMAGRSGEVKALKAQYNSIMGISELKYKLKALNYLCS